MWESVYHFPYRGKQDKIRKYRMTLIAKMIPMMRDEPSARAHADKPTPCLPLQCKLTREAERLPGPFVCVYFTF
jgi:hypothetical protein